MRQQIDCAVLMLAAHQSWMPKVLKSLEPVLSRVKLHPLEWEAGHDLELNPGFAQDSKVSLPVETLAQASIGLRRYDLVLLPVSMETIAWTRQALAAIPRGPFVPILGIFKEMRSAATQDLLEMGMADFIRLPICPEEFRARLLHTVSAVPRSGSLREPSLTYGQTIAIARGVLPMMSDTKLREWLDLTRNNAVNRTIHTEAHVKNVLAGMLPPGPESAQEKAARLEMETYVRNESVEFNQVELLQETGEKEKKNSFLGGQLKAVKAKLVEDFERAYIIEALQKNKGNIAIAARYSGKHRRAFWALMRKYDIDAEDFRT